MRSLYKGLFCILLSALAAAAFISCSQPSLSLNASSSLTLKELSQNRSSLINWTEELERYDSDASTDFGVDKTITLTPQNFFASGKTYTALVPSLEGFTSLDISGLDTQTKNLLDTFCSNMTKTKKYWIDSESLMQGDRAYALVIFIYDFEQYLDSLSLDPAKASCVQSYRLGKPFVSDNLVQCPVRFVISEEQALYADILVWVFKEQGIARIGRFTWLLREEN